MIDNLWVVMHSQYSEDSDMYPYHIGPLKAEVDLNFKDSLHNHRGPNKWQIVHVGTRGNCVEFLEAYQELKYRTKERN